MELDAEFTCPVGEGSDSDSDSDTDMTSDSDFWKSDDDMGVNTWTMSGYPIGRGVQWGGVFHIEGNPSILDDLDRQWMKKYMILGMIERDDVKILRKILINAKKNLNEWKKSQTSSIIQRKNTKQ